MRRAVKEKMVSSCNQHKQGTSVLYLNPLEGRHGSTYRARNLFKLLRELFSEAVYVESNCNHGDSQTISIRQRDNYLGYFMAMLKRTYLCWGLNYNVLFLQKALPMHWPCLLSAKLRRKKVVIDIDDLDGEWQSTPLRKSLITLLGRGLSRYADVVTTHNQYLMTHIKEMGVSKVCMVPQGVDANLFDPQKYDGTAVKKELGLEQKKILGFIGSFTIGSAIDLHVILKAFKQVEERRQDVHFLMIGGGGPLEKKYRDLIKEIGLKNFLITGRIPQPEVPRVLSALDVGLIYMEDNLANRCRMSLKLMEYLAMEKDVVGHIVGESKEVFGKYCFLSEPSIGSFADMIINVLGTTKKEKARDFIKAHYDWNVVKNSLHHLLKEIQYEDRVC
jgi:glycosyltransferase involved in cell wall biosynthesis